jgi:flagellar hook-associated protein 3 FlgL
MKLIPSFLITTLARSDLARISGELYDLQRQTASGAREQDLKGYGIGAGRIVSARTAIANSAARVDAANRLVARLDIQDAALGMAASSAAQLKQDIMTALASDDGRFLGEQLKIGFDQATDALNTTYEGVTLFAGERRAGAVITAQTLSALPAAVQTGSLYDESERTPTLDLGFGAPVTVAEKASTFSRKLYAAMRELNDIVLGEPLGQPLTADQRARLTAAAQSFDLAHRDLVEAQGRNGDTQSRVARTVERLTAESDLLTKHLGETADADLAEVAMRLATVQTQYQAAANVFSQIRNMSLVNFLD